VLVSPYVLFGILVLTQEDQDALVGRRVRELRDVKERLAKLRARAREFADSFSTVHFHLNNNLEYLRIDGERTDERFVEQERQQSGSFGRREPHIPKLATLEIKTVLEIRDEIRACVLEEKSLQESLEHMGFKNG